MRDILSTSKILFLSLIFIVSPANAQTRKLGMTITTSANQSYAKAYRQARKIGVKATDLSINWDEWEKSPRSYAPPTEDSLAIANIIYPRNQTKIDLIIRPLDTNGRHLPRDLRSLKYNDPLVIERFKQFLNYVFGKIPDLSLNFIAIGNEIDLGLAAATDAEWREYTDFFQQMQTYVKQQYPDIPCTVVATLAGANGTYYSHISQVVGTTSSLAITYYPLKAGFRVKSPAVVAADIDTLAGLFSNKKIYLNEVGYPSSPKNGSSVKRQSLFVSEIFKAWDLHQEQIPYISFSWMSDLSDLAFFKKYYGINNPRFLSYLGSLGLIDAKGIIKPAWNALKKEASLRGL